MEEIKYHCINNKDQYILVIRGSESQINMFHKFGFQNITNKDGTIDIIKASKWLCGHLIFHAIITIKIPKLTKKLYQEERSFFIENSKKSDLMLNEKEAICMAGKACVENNDTSEVSKMLIQQKNEIEQEVLQKLMSLMQKY